MCFSFLKILACGSSFTNVCVYKCEEVMNEIFLKEILNDYFKDYEFSSSVKAGEFYAAVNCNLDSAEDIVELVDMWKVYVRNQQNLEIKI